jgi:hypothetical protein
MCIAGVDCRVLGGREMTNQPVAAAQYIHMMWCGRMDYSGTTGSTGTCTGTGSSLLPKVHNCKQRSNAAVGCKYHSWY